MSDGDQGTPRLVPPEVRAALESAGASVVEDGATGDVHVALNGFLLATVRTNPPQVAWGDPATGHALMSVIAYEGLTRMLQANRGRDTFAMRGLLREQLHIDPLLVSLNTGHVTVKVGGGISKKEYDLSHPALGLFARVTVFRGQSHVVDVAFSSPRVFVPLRLLFEMTVRLRDRSPA